MDISALNIDSYSRNALFQNSASKAEGINASLAKASEKASDGTLTEKEKADLMKACTDFESYFIQSLYKEMRKTVDAVNPDGGFIKKSQAEKFFQEMLDEEAAKASAKAGGIGLAQNMYNQMTANFTMNVISN